MSKAAPAIVSPITPITPMPYAPHIEARREEYSRLAQMLIGMIDLHFETERLDLRRNPAYQEEPEHRDIIQNAIDSHLQLLVTELEMMDVASIKRFYVEMRLHVDQLRWEQEERERHYKAEHRES